jgi:hypothetical protein
MVAKQSIRDSFPRRIIKVHMLCTHQMLTTMLRHITNQRMMMAAGAAHMYLSAAPSWGPEVPFLAASGIVDN